MKPGDLVKYSKPSSATWDVPHDIPNGSIGLIVQELPNDNYGNPHTDIGVMIEGRVRLITKIFLKVINETG